MAMLRVNALISRGYFPGELPTCFSTIPLAKIAGSLTIPNGRWSAPVRHSIPRGHALRRPLSIPNPASYILAAQEIERNWTVYEPHLNAGRFSLSTPVVREAGRAVSPSTAFGDLPAARASRRKNSRFALRTDIGQFYRSIYTHSIPWGVHGKASAKSSFKANLTVVGDDLDKRIQEGQEGQTIGIPIGPDVSLVAAEIILTRIDLELKPLLALSSSASFRFMDDYEILCTTRDQADEALGHLEGLLTTFQLGLNPLKTEIVDLPAEMEPSWRTALHQFVIRRTSSEKVTERDLISFFSVAFALQREDPVAPVLRYAMTKAASSATSAGRYARFMDLSVGCLVQEPSLLDRLYWPVLVGTANGLATDDVELVAALHQICRLYSSRDYGNEVAWALWTLSSIGAPLDDSTSAIVASTRDDLVAILYLAMASAGLAKMHPMAILDDLDLTADVHLSEHWLLAYEATRYGWHPFSDVQKDAFFSQLLAADVSFLRAPSVPIWVKSARVISDLGAVRSEWRQAALDLQRGSAQVSDEEEIDAGKSAPEVSATPADEQDAGEHIDEHELDSEDMSGDRDGTGTEDRHVDGGLEAEDDELDGEDAEGAFLAALDLPTFSMKY